MKDFRSLVADWEPKEGDNVLVKGVVVNNRSGRITVEINDFSIHSPRNLIVGIKEKPEIKRNDRVTAQGMDGFWRVVCEKNDDTDIVFIEANNATVGHWFHKSKLKKV